jgi:hypothetical protein
MSLQEFYGDEWIQANLAIDAFLGFEGPDWQKTVIVQRNADGTVEVAGIVVFAPSTVNNPGNPGSGGGEAPPPAGGGDPPPPPPPGGGGGQQQGFGAGGGTNQGGASFGGGNQGHPTGNCMSQGAGQGHGHGRPDPQPCLDG